MQANGLPEPSSQACAPFPDVFWAPRPQSSHKRVFIALAALMLSLRLTSDQRYLTSRVPGTFHLEGPASPPSDGKDCPWGGGAAGQGVRQLLKVRDEKDVCGHRSTSLLYGWDTEAQRGEDVPWVVQMTAIALCPGPRRQAQPSLCAAESAQDAALPAPRPQGRAWVDEERGRPDKRWESPWVAFEPHGLWLRGFSILAILSFYVKWGGGLGSSKVTLEVPSSSALSP